MDSRRSLGDPGMVEYALLLGFIACMCIVALKDVPLVWLLAACAAGRSDKRPPKARPDVYYNHGFDDVLGFRPIGEVLAYKVDDEGLYVDVWVPREPDRKRFSGAAARRFKDVYASIAAGKTAGLSVGGTYAATGPGIKRWNMSELSVVDKPALPSATFVLRR